MHSLYIQPISLNSQYLQTSIPQKNISAVKFNDDSRKLTNTLKCMGAISFASLYPKINQQSSVIPKVLENLMASEIPVDFEVYNYMLRNPLGFYKNYGLDINRFLRSGVFKPLPQIHDDMPDVIKNYVAAQIIEQKNLNRTIYESIGILDKEINSITSEPMKVFRDAPKDWLLTEKDGYLTDKAFCSVSTERGASMEGLINNGANNFTYEIYLPENTKFWDLRDSMEKEMVLGRNHKFKILSPGILELCL